MFGICQDMEVAEGKLSQAIVEYIIEENHAIIIAPIPEGRLPVSKIRKLTTPPKFFYNDLVSPTNHLDMIGKIHTIKWHYNLDCCFYHIQVNGKVKSKRYFDEDLVGV